MNTLPARTDADLNPVDPLWSMALMIDMALGVKDIFILEAHNLQFHELEALKAQPGFVKQVAALRAELQKDGASFQMKAQVQADALLDTSWSLIHSNATPANVKADLIKSTVRWAGHEKTAAADGSGGRSGFSISINLGQGIAPPATATVTLEHEQ